MKALFELFRRFDARRIFGFIRRLGGMSRPKVECYDLRSTHALRVEGDWFGTLISSTRYSFLSTPSGWRATVWCELTFLGKEIISIHALRVEGDHPCTPQLCSCPQPFLSTPSGWRATSKFKHSTQLFEIFLSTPSGWRATVDDIELVDFTLRISIHALRVEGDICFQHRLQAAGNFYPRPPGGGRPSSPRPPSFVTVPISIHALRVEGD